MPLVIQSVINNDEVGKRKLTDIYANQRRRSDDPAWYFLGELLLSEVLAYQKRDELTNGLWVQTVCEMGMSLDYVENIKKVLTGLATDAWMQFKSGKLEATGRIRLFCPKKLIEDLSPRKSPRISYPEYAIESGQKIAYSGTHMSGGWGYFLIERGESSSLTGSSVGLWNSVDLYLYKEGD